MLQPLTGARATGQCLFKPVSDQPVVLPAGTYLSPVLNGQYRPDLTYKVPVNPNATTDCRGWTIAPGGTAVTLISNIGGKRHNVPINTVFRIEPEVGNAVGGTCSSVTAFTGGVDALDSTDPVALDLGLANVVLYETFGSSESIEQFNANLGGRWPIVMLFWAGDEPADGFANNNLSTPTKRGSHAMQYAQDFELWLVCNRLDSEPQRRGQAMRLMDAISYHLYDRMSVDGMVLSSPGGIKIKRRSRETGSGEDFFKKFRVYSMTLGVTITQRKRDVGNPAPLLRFDVDYLKTDRGPNNLNQDLPLIHDMLIPNV